MLGPASIFALLLPVLARDLGCQVTDALAVEGEVALLAGRALPRAVLALLAFTVAPVPLLVHVALVELTTASSEQLLHLSAGFLDLHIPCLFQEHFLTGAHACAKLERVQPIWIFACHSASELASRPLGALAVDGIPPHVPG